MMKKIHFILFLSALVVLVLNGCSFMLNEKFDTEVFVAKNDIIKLVDFKNNPIDKVEENSYEILTWKPVVYATGYDIECYTSKNSFVKIFQISTAELSLRELREIGVSYVIIVPYKIYSDQKFTCGSFRYSL